MIEDKEKFLDALDTLYTCKGRLEFISNLLLAWDVKNIPLQESDLMHLSYITDDVVNMIDKCDSNLSYYLKEMN